jgi:bla regulator protein BlaR1
MSWWFVAGIVATEKGVPMRAMKVMSLVIFGFRLLLCQQTTPDAFEAASIRPAAPGARGDSTRTPPGGGLSATNVTLRHLIGFAYQVRESQIYGGPSWVESERYDVIAKAANEEGVAAARPRAVRERLQTLLSERFHLSVHRETKDLPVFALVVTRSGHKLRASTAAEDESSTLSQRAAGEILARRASMQMFASALTDILGRPVLDKTGLAGPFDFTLRWDPAATMPADLRGTPDLPGASIFTAVQEQLGLKLESQKGPVEVIMIDRAEHPSEN